MGKRKSAVADATTKLVSIDDAMSSLVSMMNTTTKDMRGKDIKSSGVAAYSDPWSKVVDWISTTCVPVDVLLWGGIPRGRIVEIFGHPSEGKSTLLESLFLGNQLAGGINVLIMSEGCIDTARMQRMGIDLTRLIFSEVESFEEGLYQINNLFTSMADDSPLRHIPILVGWDSISNSQEESTRKSGNPFASGIASKARSIRQAMRSIVTPATYLNVTFVFLSQTHATINDRFGRGWNVDGGGGIKFNASLRLWVHQTSKMYWENIKPEEIGIWSAVRIEKSKCGPPPFREVQMPIRSMTGIDNDIAMFHFLQSVTAQDTDGNIILRDNSPSTVICTAGSWKQILGWPSKPCLSFRSDDYVQVLNDNRGLRQWLADQCTRACPVPMRRPIVEPDVIAEESTTNTTEIKENVDVQE